MHRLAGHGVLFDDGQGAATSSGLPWASRITRVGSRLRHHAHLLAALICGMSTGMTAVGVWVGGLGQAPVMWLGFGPSA